jgi:hypothetical protein
VKASRGRREAGQGREEHKEEMNHEGRKESEGRRKRKNLFTRQLYSTRLNYLI